MFICLLCIIIEAGASQSVDHIHSAVAVWAIFTPVKIWIQVGSILGRKFDPLTKVCLSETIVVQNFIVLLSVNLVFSVYLGRMCIYIATIAYSLFYST